MLGSAGDAVQAAPHRALDDALRGGLAAQQAGRLAEAATAYERALALDPDSFDALHMLGVVRFQLGEFERALPLVVRACELRPDIVDARKNRLLVEGGIERRHAERELSRNILPRLAPLCEPDATTLPGVLSIVVPPLIAQAESTAIAHMSAHAHSSRVDLWSPSGSDRGGLPPGFPVRVLDSEAGARPSGGSIAALGASPEIGHWLDAAAPDRVAWIVTSDEPGIAIDRLRELSGQGRRRVALYFGDAGIARALGLPGVVLGATTAARQ